LSLASRNEGGVTNYLEVITAQNAALTDEVTAVNILGRRMASAVLLIQALGGSWDRVNATAARVLRAADHRFRLTSLSREEVRWTIERWAAGLLTSGARIVPLVLNLPARRQSVMVS
jgi:thiamine pyrophosphokinase